jgi:hypothetical protein
MFELQEQDETGEFKNAYLDFMQNNHTFDDFIDRKKEKVAKRKMENTLNAFIDDEVKDGTIDTGLDSGIEQGSEQSQVSFDSETQKQSK